MLTLIYKIKLYLVDLKLKRLNNQFAELNLSYFDLRYCVY